MRLRPRLLAWTADATGKICFFVAPTRRNPRPKPRRRGDRAAKTAGLNPAAFRGKLVRPGVPALEGKIVSVRHGAPLRGRRGFENLIRNAVALAIGHRLFLGIE